MTILFLLCMLSFSEVVDIDIEDNGDGTVNIYYTVEDAGDYTLSIKFGGQPIPEGFYTFTVSHYFFYFHQFSNRLLIHYFILIFISHDYRLEALMHIKYVHAHNHITTRL